MIQYVCCMYFGNKGKFWADRFMACLVPCVMQRKYVDNPSIVTFDQVTLSSCCYREICCQLLMGPICTHNVVLVTTTLKLGVQQVLRRTYLVGPTQNRSCIVACLHMYCRTIVTCATCYIILPTKKQSYSMIHEAYRRHSLLWSMWWQDQLELSQSTGSTWELPQSHDLPNFLQFLHYQ